MCGIVGFTGRHQAAPILLDGLSKLEYRGYDSAGIAVRDGEKDTIVIKAKGRLKGLQEKTNDCSVTCSAQCIRRTCCATRLVCSAIVNTSTNDSQSKKLSHSTF